MMGAMSRTHVRRRRALVLVIGAILAALWSGAVANARDDGRRAPAVPARTYVVRSGDTLWSIAIRLAPERDPRSVVDTLVSMNHLGGEPLIPGRAIRLPA